MTPKIAFSILPPSKLIAVGILALAVCAPGSANAECQWVGKNEPRLWVCDDPNPPRKTEPEEPIVLEPTPSTGPSPFGPAREAWVEQNRDMDVRKEKIGIQKYRDLQVR